MLTRVRAGRVVALGLLAGTAFAAVLVAGAGRAEATHGCMPEGPCWPHFCEIHPIFTC